MIPAHKVKTAVKKIVDDIQERCGLGNEWELIDQLTQQEIKDEWFGILLKELEKP